MSNFDLSTLDNSQMQISWQYQPLKTSMNEDFGFHDLWTIAPPINCVSTPESDVLPASCASSLRAMLTGSCICSSRPRKSLRQGLFMRVDCALYCVTNESLTFGQLQRGWGVSELGEQTFLERLQRVSVSSYAPINCCSKFTSLAWAFGNDLCGELSEIGRTPSRLTLRLLWLWSHVLSRKAFV